MKKIALAIIITLTSIMLSSCSASEAQSTSPASEISITNTEFAPTPKESINPREEPKSNPTAASLPSPVYYSGEIDVSELLDEMEAIVQVINHPVSSLNDFEQIDLLYFLFNRSWKESEDSCLTYIKTSINDEGPDYKIKPYMLEKFLYAYFGLSSDYLDKYKNGDYKFFDEFDSYNADDDTFSFAAASAYRGVGINFAYSPSDTLIEIDGSNITVKTMIYGGGSVKKSADYKFFAHKLNGKIRYRLTSVDTYDDERNKNIRIMTLDGTDFFAPWYTVKRSGKLEYSPSYNYDYGFESWTNPYPMTSVLSSELDKTVVNDITGIYKCRIYKNVAYLGFVYYGVCDTYVYDIEAKTGHWMSGAEDLEVFYKKELETLRKARKAELESDGYKPYRHYRNFDIVTIAEEHGYALVRRSIRPGESAGEYLMRNLTTGEETFICDSYTRDPERTVSFMDERFDWLNGDHLLLGICANLDGAWMIVYDVIYDGQSWVVNESDRLFDE